jgi:hypothetical protein
LIAAELSSSCATSAGGGIYAGSAPAMSGGVQRSSSEPLTPEERSGLATGRGPEKPSRTWERDFIRASDQPAGSDAIYYNDPQGIRAMSPDLKPVAAMQETAGGLVEWGVRGKASFLMSYRENGAGRRLVQGEKDSAYSLVVRNKSLCTVEVVFSVDGLDVIDGQPASFRKRGYLIDGGETFVVEGFRTNKQSVAEFRFSSVAGSFANQSHGNTRNLGVLGLAVFTSRNDQTHAAPPGDFPGGARPSLQ